MKILLAGDTPGTAALLQVLAHVRDDEITHCADGARAIIELLRNGYDWAIINGRAVSGGETDVARLIRAMGPDIQDKPAACSRSGDKANAGGRHSSCGVEWTKDGVLQLHCGLHQLLKAGALPRRDNLGCAGEILFEYHAPCSKARGRHG